jgi:hypothetical protein
MVKCGVLFAVRTEFVNSIYTNCGFKEIISGSRGAFDPVTTKCDTLQTGKSHIQTGYGAPVHRKDASLTVGARGPMLLQDVEFLDELAHFDRERIPERVVHAKGAGELRFAYCRMRYTN